MALFGSGNFSTTLPALTASPVWGSADAASTLPLLSQSAAGGLAWTASTTFPKLLSVTSNQGGFQASVVLPKIISEGVGIAPAYASTTLPKLEGVGYGISGGNGYAVSVLPKIRGAGVGGRGGFASITLPKLTSSAIGYADITFAADTTFPLLEMSATWGAVLTELFDVWVMDATTKGVSQYTSYNYNSFGKRDGVNFGANENGIYRLDAETDAGENIESQLLFAPTGFYYEGIDFGLNKEEATKQKRSASIYLVCRSDDDLQLLVKVDEDKYRVYDIDTSDDPAGMHNKRIIPGRGLKGVVWQLGIANQNGADFELAAIKAYPIVLSRRV